MAHRSRARFRSAARLSESALEHDRIEKTLTTQTPRREVHKPFCAASRLGAFVAALAPQDINPPSSKASTRPALFNRASGLLLSANNELSS